MLEELHIRDIALIEDAWISFQPGLTVLTGETGAGKTALLSALKLLMGERVDLGVIRHDAPNALVEAQFSGDVVASRRIERTGRHKATLCGELTNAQALANTIGPLIDLHGQHEHQELLRVSAHGRMLDVWGGTEIADKLAAYNTSYTLYHDAVQRHRTLIDSVQKASQEAETAKLIVAEIDRTAPAIGEDDDIRSQLPLLEHAEELSQRMQAAYFALSGENGALDTTAQAVHQLEKIIQHDERIRVISQSIESAGITLSEAARDLKDLEGALTFDPAQLEQSLARLAELESLAKRFGPTLQAVLDRRQELTETLTLAQDSSEAVAHSMRELEAAKQSLLASNERLGEVRQQASNRFSQLVSDAMQKLEMDGCSFTCKITEREFAQWGSSGGQHIEFLFTPSPKMPPRPLVKIASGGEVSRVMLAIKSVLGEADSVPTLVFDEIDAGIGGATALAIGSRLVELAKTHQVIVVTHLAQVAAYADHHYVVRKVEDGTGPTTVVVPVEAEVRVAEIARMLSGEITEVSTQHARELLGAAL